jgi:nitrite reductase (NADH) small subunit
MKRRTVIACRAADVPPGGRRLVEIEGISIGIFNVHGRYVAVRNVCPHAFAPVCLGRVGGTILPAPPGELRWGREGEILACPWHGWEFDLLTGRGLADRLRHVRLYPVRVAGDDVLVTL